MKLSRKQKIIRNTAIVIVLIAALPLLFDMHFSPDKAAHEALEKAGCEDADYIAQYETVCSEKLLSTINESINSEIYYSCKNEGAEYVAAVPYKRYFGFLFKAENAEIKRCDRYVKIKDIRETDENRKTVLCNISGRFKEFTNGQTDDCSCRTELYRNENDEDMLYIAVCKSVYGDDDGGSEILMNMSTNELLSCKETKGEILENGKIAATGTMKITEKRAKEICNELYHEIAAYMQEESGR